MSGHSKWHNIQVRKGKQDKLKANAFTKVGRLITIAARQGGGDPNMNFSLRLAIEKAKEVNFPKENIDRAIKKGTGGGEENNLEEIVYEGFGPGGIGVLVDVLTDNKNRTAPEMKHIFSQFGGSLAGPGAVKWQFIQKGVVHIGVVEKQKIADQDVFELALIEAGADDIETHDFGVEIYTPVDKFQTTLEAVKKLGITPSDPGIEWVAKETLPVDEPTSEKMAELYDALDGLDDVRSVYTNEA